MGLKEEIALLVKRKLKNRENREKTYAKHCKRCGYGTVTISRWESNEWDRIHKGHEKSFWDFFKRG